MKLDKLPDAWRDEINIATANAFGVGEKQILLFINALLASNKAEIEYDTNGEWAPVEAKRLVIELG